MTTSEHKPLPFSWIEEIFKTMFTNYGSAFLRKWSSGVLDAHNQFSGDFVPAGSLVFLTTTGPIQPSVYAGRREASLHWDWTRNPP